MGNRKEKKEMNTAQPIRNREELEKMKVFYRYQVPSPRNELLIVIGLNTALRISDLLSLQWKDIYDFERKAFREHICITEKKTGKFSSIYVNSVIQKELKEYQRWLKKTGEIIFPEKYLFCHQKENVPISRVQAFRIIKKAADFNQIEGVISCHSLRKTFGYHAWKQGISPVLLMNIYNHSSFQVTQRYLGIEQDDRDEVFQKIHL